MVGTWADRTAGSEDCNKSQRVPFALATMILEAQHQMISQGRHFVIGAQPLELCGRVDSCGVEFAHFVLAPCDSDLRDSLRTRLREVSMKLGMASVQLGLEKMASECFEGGETLKENSFLALCLRRAPCLRYPPMSGTWKSESSPYAFFCGRQRF